MRGLIGVMGLAMAVWGQPGWAAQDDPRLDGVIADLQKADQPGAVVAIETEIWRIWIETKDGAEMIWESTRLRLTFAAPISA